MMFFLKYLKKKLEWSFRCVATQCQLIKLQSEDTQTQELIDQDRS